MSTMRVTTLKNEASTADQIVLNADGSFGGELATQLGSKVDYPSGGSDGNVLTKSGTAAAWIGANLVGGLVQISSDPFSAVSSVSINGCFTSTYKNYRVMLEITSASTSAQIHMRLRASSTDNTSSNYWQHRIFGQASSVSGSGQTSAQTSFIAVSEYETGVASAVIDIFSPQAAQNTSHVTTGQFRYTAFYQHSHITTGQMTVNTAYDGFTLFHATGGTITGTLRVYGYRD